MLRLSLITLGACAALVACDEGSSTPNQNDTGSSDTVPEESFHSDTVPGETFSSDTVDPDNGPAGEVDVPEPLPLCPTEWVGEGSVVAGASFPNIPGVAIAPSGFPESGEATGSFSVSTTTGNAEYGCGADGVQGCSAPVAQVVIDTAAGPATVGLSVPLGQLELIPDGTQVTAQVDAAKHSNSRLLLADDDGPLLLAASYRSATIELVPSDELNFGPIQVSFGAPSCKMERDQCLIAYHSMPLTLSASDGDDTLDLEVQAETALGFEFQGVAYRVHHARSAEAVYEEGACAPFLPGQSDFWIMRIPAAE